MLITIHKIVKYKKYWKVTFTSERNPTGVTIMTPVFSNDDELFKYIEDYINNNLPLEVIEKEMKKDTSEITVSEPEPEPEPEPTEEEQQLSEMLAELDELERKKDEYALQIKTLLEDWKLDLDLVKFKKEFSIENEDFDAIIQAKIGRKLPKYVELKTTYENLKQQIETKKEEIRQFAEENNLEVNI